IKQLQELELSGLEARPANDIIKAWDPGRVVGIYNPISARTSYEPKYIVDPEYKIIRDLPEAEALRLKEQYLDNMGPIWRVGNEDRFNNWFSRVRAGMD